MTQHTIVQHSGFGYAGDTQFQRGLESRQVPTGRPSTEKQITDLGGLLFPDYTSAERYCDEEMYRNTGGGMIPHAAGTFADYEVDGLAVYIPEHRPIKAPLRLALIDGDGTVIDSTEVTVKELATATMSDVFPEHPWSSPTEPEVGHGPA